MKFSNDANPTAHRLFPSNSPNITETTFEILIADVLLLRTHPTDGDGDVDLREDEAHKEVREEP